MPAKLRRSAPAVTPNSIAPNQTLAQLTGVRGATTISGALISRQRRFVISISRFEKPEPFSFPSIFADACDIVPV